MKKVLKGILVASAVLWAGVSHAADYVVDDKGAHAFIQFKIQHLGYSWLYGRFNEFSGEFSYDANNPNASKISVDINVASLDSNHAERDKHLRSGDFLDTAKHPKAKFVSTGFKDKGNGAAILKGNLTLHGVTKPVVIEVTKIGEGKDPWGGYRVGFSGTTTIRLGDFGIPEKLGPASTHVQLMLDIEGIRKSSR